MVLSFQNSSEAVTAWHDRRGIGSVAQLDSCGLRDAHWQTTATTDADRHDQRNFGLREMSVGVGLSAQPLIVALALWAGDLWSVFARISSKLKGGPTTALQMLPMRLLWRLAWVLAFWVSGLILRR